MPNLIVNPTPMSALLRSLRHARSPLVSSAARSAAPPASPRPGPPPTDHPAADQRSIAAELSQPVPPGSSFPEQVLLPGGQLNVDNLYRTVDGLGQALKAALPMSRETAGLHDALQAIPRRLVAGTQAWYRKNAAGARSHIPREQFNLLVVDEWRRVARSAFALADHRHATPEERAIGKEMGALCTALKRLHYSSNVPALYEASGKRLLPMLNDAPETMAPGYRADMSTKGGAQGGLGLTAGAADIGGLLALKFGSQLVVSRADDHDFLVEPRRTFSIGPKFDLTAALGPTATLGGLEAGVDLKMAGGNQIKAARREQAQFVYAENLYRKGSPLFPSAAPRQREVIRRMMAVGNGLTTALFGAKHYDPHAPLHASRRKWQKGLYGEDEIQQRARALDRLALPRMQAGENGPIEAILQAAYPSTRQRIEAMSDAPRWTPAQVDENLPGPNPTTYGRMGMNAPGTSRLMRAPTRSTRIEASVGASIGPKESVAGPHGTLLATAPQLGVDITLPALYDQANNYQIRLVPLAEQVDVSKQADFAPSLRQLELACRLYDASYPWPGGHPHLRLMRRMDAMADLQAGSRPACSADELAAALAGEGEQGIYGDPKTMPPAIAHGIAALRIHRWLPGETMMALERQLTAFSEHHARFIAEATQAWALRKSPGGAALLQGMNERMFDGAVPLPARPESGDFAAFFERAHDATALALANLSVQLSVAQREIERALKGARPEEQERFRHDVERCAALHRTQTALMATHRLPIDKQDALRASTLKSAARITSKTRPLDVDFSFQLGLTDPMSFIARAPSVQRSRGAYGASVRLESRHQNSSVNPALVGRFLKVEFAISGDDFLRQFASLVAALREAHTSGPHAGQIPGAILDELERLGDPLQLMTRDFDHHELTYAIQWRLAPEEAESPAPHASRPPTEGALQYVRISERNARTFAGKTPNLLVAVPPGMLKLSGEAERSVTRTLRQENGICPASNILEWNGSLRQRFVNPKTGQLLDRDAIARELAAHPQDATRLFSRFNPVCLVPQSFAQAVREPDGPRNEFHRMLYGAEFERQRNFAMEASRFDPASGRRLFEPSPHRCELDPLVAEARHWEPSDREELRALSRMSLAERRAHFLDTPRGRTQLERYARLMEAATSFNNWFRTGANGYVLAVDRALIESRQVRPPEGAAQHSRGAAGLAQRLAAVAGRPAISRPRPARRMHTAIGVAPHADKVAPPSTRF